MKLPVLFLCLVLALAIPSGMAHADPISDLFETHFREQYRPRYCGLNALNFVKAIAKLRGSAEGFHIVHVENKGFSVFGMVNAEHTRGSRFNKPAVDEANWYHHAFVLDDQGNVYDFDFGIEPRIVPIGQYLEEMFLKEATREQGGSFYVGRQDKLNDYLFEAVPADAALNEEKPPPRKAKMGQVQKNWRLLIEDFTQAFAACPDFLGAKYLIASDIEQFLH